MLCAHEVEFVLIGGLALAFHGVVRATKDVDVVPAPWPENLERLRDALRDLAAEPADGKMEGAGNRVMHTRLGRIDVMQRVAGIADYAELRAGAVEQDVPEIGASIWVAGFDELIAMKEESGRDQDLIEITALRMAHGLEE